MAQIWLVPAFPLLGFLLNGFLGKQFGSRFVSIVGPLAIGLAFAQSLVLFFQMLNVEGNVLSEHLYTWIKSGNFEVGINFHVDQLSGLYLLVITGIGFLIHLFVILQQSSTINQLCRKMSSFRRHHFSRSLCTQTLWQQCF